MTRPVPSAPRVLVIGAYDPTTPRTRQWFRLLELLGAEVDAHPTTTWDRDRVEASTGSPLALAWRLARGLLGAIWYLLRCPRPDVVVFCYPGHVDACVLGLVARLRRIPTVLDAFISLYDTVVSDRALHRPRSPIGIALRLLDTFACWSVGRSGGERGRGGGVPAHGGRGRPDGDRGPHRAHRGGVDRVER
ncbi:MAG: hypothetical protein ACKOOG_06025, partial [Actinomycetota bacterium]